MKKLVNEIIAQVNNAIVDGTINLIKLEDFHSPEIYAKVCEYFSKKNDIKFVAKIDVAKYNEFQRRNNPEWEPFLKFLKDNGYVDFDNPLTKYRNAITNSNEFALLLLMGAEAAVDKGSIKDFKRIALSDIVAKVKKDYSLWFNIILENIDDPDKEKQNRQIINNICSSIYKHANVSVDVLSSFIDQLETRSVDSIEELIEIVFESLPVWNMPRISQEHYKISSIKAKSKKNVDILITDYNFINNLLASKPSVLKKYEKQLAEYAKEKSIDVDDKFDVFSSYTDFQDKLLTYLKDEQISTLRPLFMKSDYGIINDILKLKLPKETAKEEKEKVFPVYGEPLEAFFKMISNACIRYRDMPEHGYLPNQLTFDVTKMKLSNCLSDDSDDSDDSGDNRSSLEIQYHGICTFMGGMLKYVGKQLGDSISLDYINDIDPFDYENYDNLADKLDAVKKIGVNCEIMFTVCATGDIDTDEKKFQYKWIFSPYAGWKNSFSIIDAWKRSSDDYSEDILPALVCCNNIGDFINCETETEFYAKMDSIQSTHMSDDLIKQLSNSFSDHDVINKFNLVCEEFKEWYNNISAHGFFTYVDSMNRMISVYSSMLESLTAQYDSLSSVMKDKAAWFLYAFTIIGNKSFFKDGASAEVIVPAYHPAMLDKIIAQSVYYIQSFREMLSSFDNIRLIDCDSKIGSIKELGMVNQGVDTIPSGNNDLTCQSIWGYYAICTTDDYKTNLVSSAELINSEVDVDEEMSPANISQVRVIKRNIIDYIKTFPSRIDGINIAFIAPTEIQYVVKGIEEVSKWLEGILTDSSVTAVINLSIICLGGSKNVGGYLRYWLDSYLSKERNVKIFASLNYLQETRIKSVRSMLKNTDLCFIYNILDNQGILFDTYQTTTEEEELIKSSYQFPMTFIPDTIPFSGSNMRKVNISQPQFIVSDKFTQLAHKVKRPNEIENKYKIMQKLVLSQEKESILSIAHEECRWVVCEDRAIDRELLQSESAKIIGFTTGEGCFGEYNVTISARENVIKDIKQLLKKRLCQKFIGWDEYKAEQAAENCIALTKSFDGSRLLRALNQRDYEIHNFLAYVLTVQSLGINDAAVDKDYFARVLLNMDSYQHWFTEENNRPDFLLVEIPNIPENNSSSGAIKLRIKVIECKMSNTVDQLIDKAMTQVSVGLDALKNYWDPSSNSVNRRYWYTQLYRAIAFSKLLINDNSPEYETVKMKIMGILNGNFVVDWSGDIYAYGINENSDDIVTTVLNYENGMGINLHRAGQIYIQRMILPSDLQKCDLLFSEVEEPDDSFDCDDVDNDSNDETETDEVLVGNPDESLYQELVTVGAGIEEVNAETPIEEETSSIDGIPDEPLNENGTERSDNIDENTFDNETVTITEQPTSNRKPLSEVRVLLGKDSSGKEYYWEFGNKQLTNRHLLINGNSGSGKTYLIQCLLLELSKQGIPAIIFDYTAGFLPSKLEPEFKEKMGKNLVQRIVQIDKIPVNPFARSTVKIDEGIIIPEDNAKIATRVRSALANVYNFGEQQKSIIYQAIKTGMERFGNNMSFTHLAEILTEMGEDGHKSTTDSVLNKLIPFIDLEAFEDGDDFSWDTIKSSDGMVYVFQMQGYQREDQLLFVEFLLRDLWNHTQNNGEKNKPFVVVLDEAQNLRHNSESPTGKILTEGRKFGVSGWFATQFMGGQLDRDEIQILQQAAQKLYFCPPDDGVMDTAKSIDINSSAAKEWAEKLKKLKLGECITCGAMDFNGKFTRYQPRQIRVTSLEERCEDDDK